MPCVFVVYAVKNPFFETIDSILRYDGRTQDTTSRHLVPRLRQLLPHAFSCSKHCEGALEQGWLPRDQGTSDTNSSCPSIPNSISLGKSILVVNLCTRRKILPYPKWIHNRRICDGQEMETWQPDRNGWSSHRLPMPTNKASQQKAGRWLYASRSGNVWRWHVAHLVRQRSWSCG